MSALNNWALRSVGYQRTWSPHKAEHGEQSAAFKALGISVQDANKNLKSSDQVLLEVANAFSKFEDGTTKTALAIAIFGRAGADLIPLLNQGADGIRKMQEQAQRLGLVDRADRQGSRTIQ